MTIQYFRGLMVLGSLYAATIAAILSLQAL